MEYSERKLSDDFIMQAKSFSKSKDGNKMSLKLYQLRLEYI